MNSTARITTAALALLLASACSTPPGPQPSSPAPVIPEDAIAYDDLLKGDRAMPFDNTCQKVTADVVAAVGLAKAETTYDLTKNPSGCEIVGESEGRSEPGAVEAMQLSVSVVPTEPPNVMDVFKDYWSGKGAASYFRRAIIADRYYATRTIGFDYESNPMCVITVDTGSPEALRFSYAEAGFLAEYGLMDRLKLLGYDTPRDKVDRFMADVCPAVEEKVVKLLAAIDPDGGSRSSG